jgi:hypothetical protein
VRHPQGVRLECAGKNAGEEKIDMIQAVFRIHRIHMFLGYKDPDPLVRSMDPDPSIIKQK